MDNGNLYRQLYTLLEQNVFFGDRLSERQFVTMLVPGQFVSTNLRKESPNDRSTLAQLADKSLDSTFLWRPLASTVSGLYREIVEFAALPEKPVDQRRIKQLASELNGMQDAYDAFRTFYEETDGALRRAMEQDPVNENLVIELTRKRATALRNWENPNKGKKTLYETTLGELNQHLSGNPRTFWETEVRQRFVDARQQAPNGDYFPTPWSPHPADWSASGWQTMRLDVKSVFERDFSRSTSYSAGGGVNFGLWSIGGSYSRSTREEQHHSDVTDMTIQFELLRANISRPWMYQDLLARRYWAWKKTHENLLITDGGTLPSERPLGPRGMTAERTYTGQFANGTISIDQPQIIAVGGLLPPRCPNPDPGLSWSTRPGEEPWLTPPSEPVDLALVAEAKRAHLEELMTARLRRELLADAAAQVSAMDLNQLSYARAAQVLAPVPEAVTS
jgi:hypothetical protein